MRVQFCDVDVQSGTRRWTLRGKTFTPLASGFWRGCQLPTPVCRASQPMPGRLESLTHSQNRESQYVNSILKALSPRNPTDPHQRTRTSQLFRLVASTTSKFLSRALWVRRSPYRFTFNYPLARMATNAASHNPSKEKPNCSRVETEY